MPSFAPDERSPGLTRLRIRLLQDPRPQFVIAGEIGIAPATLSLYAQGRDEIRPLHLVLMCEYWQCGPEEIIGDAPTDVLWEFYEQSLTPEDRDRINRYSTGQTKEARRNGRV